MNSAIKVLIVGGGQIGSRHLQGALKSTHRLSITIVDPSLSSLELSKRVGLNQLCWVIQAQP